MRTCRRHRWFIVSAAVYTIAACQDPVRPRTVFLSPAAGDNQTGLAGFALNVRPAVRVRDQSNAAVTNARVDFAVSSGGSVTGTPAVTDGSGIATLGSWTVQFGSNTLTATVGGSGFTGSPLTFTATGALAQYHIDIRYLTDRTPAQEQAFNGGKTKWERLIYGDVPDGFVDIPADTLRKYCTARAPAVNELLDDVIIFVELDSIDGPGQILGQAGPCLIRDPDSSHQPAIGVMVFDTADVANLITAGGFEQVVLHEMGHVLGFGTVWPLLDLLVGPRETGGMDPHFVGQQAIAAFDANGGASYSAGLKIPVENCATGVPPACGAGSWDGHWRESVFRNELMTGFVNQGVNPLSVISTASMGDLGYRVNNAASDQPYTVSGALALHAAEPGSIIELQKDILRRPLMVMDARGKVVRVIQPR